jgi:hypothetical protein
VVEEGFDFVGDEAGWQEQVGLQGAVLHDLGNVTPDEFCEIPCGRCVEQGLANVPQHTMSIWACFLGCGLRGFVAEDSCGK